VCVRVSSLDKSCSTQAPPNDDVIDGVQHYLHVVGVGCASHMDIDQLIGILVLGMKGIFNQLTASVIRIGSGVRLKTRAGVEWDGLDFFLENITFVEKENNRGFGEESRITDFVEDVECLFHSVHSFVFIEC